MEQLIIRNIRLENEFTTLSNRTLQDPKISWAAKGLLAYILSQSSEWKVHVWQLAKVYAGDKIGNKRDSIKNLLKELRDNEYILYKKSQDEQGRWQHSYTVFPMRISLFQKMFPETEFPATESPATESPSIITRNKAKKDLLKKTTTGAAPPTPAVVVSSSEEIKTKTKPEPKIYECLKPLKLPESLKIQATRKYSEAECQKAVDYVTHETTKITTSLARAFNWALSAQPEVSQPKVATIEKNVTEAKQMVLKSKLQKCHKFEWGDKGVKIELERTLGWYEFYYDDKQFIEKFTEFLEKCKRYDADKARLKR